jgi:hypothetical protein
LRSWHKKRDGIPSTINGAIIIALPYKAIEQLPNDLFTLAPELAAIIDAGNYPMRDGRIGVLDGPIADTQWVAQRFGAIGCKGSQLDFGQLVALKKSTTWTAAKGRTPSFWRQPG